MIKMVLTILIVIQSTFVDTIQDNTIVDVIQTVIRLQ